MTTSERVEQAILEAVDRIDNDGRDTREVLEWFAGQISPTLEPSGAPK